MFSILFLTFVSVVSGSQAGPSVNCKADTDEFTAASAVGAMGGAGSPANKYALDFGGATTYVPEADMEVMITGDAGYTGFLIKASGGEFKDNNGGNTKGNACEGVVDAVSHNNKDAKSVTTKYTWTAPAPGSQDITFQALVQTSAPAKTYQTVEITLTEGETEPPTNAGDTPAPTDAPAPTEAAGSGASKLGFGFVSFLALGFLAW